jgi:hypothetical protein
VSLPRYPLPLRSPQQTSQWNQLEYQAGPLALNHNPRNGQPYFNTSLFNLPTLGSIGNSGRRMFSGPGIDNYDFNLRRTLKFTDTTSVELRLDRLQHL